MAASEVITDFKPIKEVSEIGFKPLAEDSGIITDFQPIGPSVEAPFRAPEPPPFKIDEYINEWYLTRPTDEESPHEDVANVFEPMVRPFQKFYYSAAEQLNRGIFHFATNLGTVFEHLNEKAENPIPSHKLRIITEQMSEIYEANAGYWQALAAKSGPDFLNEFLGKFAGGLGPGAAEFIFALKSFLVYPLVLGAAEAKKQGHDTLGELTGGILKAAETGILGLIFKSLGPFNLYSKAPILGTTFGLEDAGKQLVTTGKIDPGQTVESAATGFGLGLTPGGRMGYKDIVRDFRSELRRVETKMAPSPSPILEGITIEHVKGTGSQEGLEIFTALKDGKEIGSFDVEPLKEGFKGIVMEVKPEFRKQKIGTSLMKAAEVEYGKMTEETIPSEEGKKFLKGYETIRQVEREKEQAGKVRLGAPPVPPTFTFADPAIEKSYQESVPKKETVVSAIGEFFTKTWHDLTRTYEHLPRGVEFAQLEFDLKKLEKQKGVASYGATKRIIDVLSTMPKAEYDLFARKVTLDDLSREADRGHDIPWGFDAPSVKAELVRVDAAIGQNPTILNALKERKTMHDTLNTDYIDAMKAIGRDVSDLFENDVYFHHQVLEYANLEGLYGTGKRLRTPASRGFLKAREGSELDINRDFIQPEYEVIAQMLFDIQIAKTIKGVDENFNIIDQVKKDAKQNKITDWHDAIPKGYVSWQPREGNVFYMADSIPAKLAEQIHLAGLEGLGVTETDLKQVLAVGRKRREFVVKEEVAETLDNLVQARPESAFERANKDILKGWKIWQLVSPRRFFKYNFRNLTGDADAVFVGNPHGFLETPEATKELGEVFINKKEITGELKEFFERGGFSSTLQVQEMGDLPDLWTFERLYREQNAPKATEIPYRVWKKYWKTVRVSTDMRETILRYANYLDYLKQMEKSPDGRPDNFGASKPDEIMALKDIRDRAYWLQNDLLGAYDRISVAGQVIRQYLFPFWSWKELNFKRYLQFGRNVAEDGHLAQAIGKKTLGIAARTPFMAYQAGKFLIKATGFWAALQVWNHTMFPKEEDELSENEQTQPHIILGTDSDGNVINFNRIGALGDFLEWFGLDAGPKYVEKWFKGEMTLAQIAVEMVKSPINVIVSGITPQAKIPFELATQRTLFPEVFAPGTIRDRGLYLARSFGLENEYKAIAGLPSRGYGESLKTFFVYSADPGQGAYSDMQDAKRRWMKENNKEAEGFWLTPKGNALYNLKLAIRYKDVEATNKYMYEYFTLGGTAKGIEIGLERMHPLADLSKRDKNLFMQSLSSSEAKRLEQAMEFYYTKLRGLK